MPNNVQVKSVLAKLLATEDIDVIHDAKMPTAAFDVKNRKLYLPVWKEMSNSMYDLFIGHEVGHAHETPEEGWHDAVCDTPQLKAFYNIIEDARIERKVKSRYPGLVKSFHKGYQELFDKNFFGVKGKDLTKLPFVDRVNLHFKIGHLLGLKFTEQEQEFLNRVEKTETWDDVKTLAHELADISAKEAEERADELEPLQQMLDDLMSEMDDLEESTPDWNNYMPDHMKEDDEEEGEGEGEGEGEAQEDDTKDEWGNPKPGTPGGSKGEDETDEEYNERREQEYKEEHEKYLEERKRRAEEYEAEQKANELFNEDVKKNKEKKEELQGKIDEVNPMHEFLNGEGQSSITDNAFRDNEKSLVDTEAQEIVYLKPQKLHKAKDWIVSMDDLYDWDKCIELSKITKDSNDYWNYNETELPNSELPEVSKTLYKKFLTETAPIINSMAQQFELKKAAAANKKARESKTGQLNEDKLWAYKLTEDLFQKNMIIPNGKNHGIIMYVDLSGSMYRQMAGTLEQMMNMALFCRKVNIPFDVYGFSNNRPYDYDSGVSTSPYSENKDLNRAQIEACEDGEMIITDDSFALVHMLSSTCRKSQFINAMSYLLLMKIGYNRSRYYSEVSESDNPYFGRIKNEYFTLGGTPLNAAIMLAPEVAKDFQSKYGVEKLTTIFLTDGGATDGVSYRDTSRDMAEHSSNRLTRAVYGEPIVIKKGGSTTQLPSKSSYSRRDGVTTATLLEFYKRVTGSTLLNFHIVDGKRDSFYNEFVSTDWMEDKEPSYYMDRNFLEVTWKEVLKNKFTVTEPAFGYDARFLLKGQKDLNIDNQELTVKSNKKGDLLRGFRNFNKNKKTSRTFLNQIIDLVA